MDPRQAQVLATGFAVELRPFADGGRSATAFAPHLEGVGGARWRVCFPYLPEGVDRLVEIPDLLRPDGIFCSHSIHLSSTAR